MKRKIKRKYIKYGLAAVCLLILGVCFLEGKDLSVQAILDMTPQSPMLAAIVLLLLYAGKSITLFFPLIILEIAVGHLFSPWAALGVNFAGILIILTIPYWIGRKAGMDAIQKLLQRYPRLRELVDRQQDSSLFLCFFLRVINCLPGDVVTMYLGATQTPFGMNLFAGTLGLLPGMILATLMGSSIREPGTPAFWISAMLMVTLSALSVLLYCLYRRRLRRKGVNNSKM